MAAAIIPNNVSLRTFRCLAVESRDEGTVKSKEVCVAPGIRAAGKKEVVELLVGRSNVLYSRSKSSTN